VAAGAEHRPAVGIAEEAVGGPFHVLEVLGAGADPAEDPHHALDEERRLDDPAFEEVGEVVEVTDVVALELEAGAAGREPGDEFFDVGEGVAEDSAFAALQVALFPVVFPLRDAAGDREDPSGTSRRSTSSP
jgi:hypothetical protein